MFKAGDKVVFTKHVINTMEESKGNRKIFPDDKTLTWLMYKEVMGREFVVFKKADGIYSKIKEIKNGNLNWDLRWFELYEEKLKMAEDF